MNFNPDDPRWTAYALGESDPADRTRMDAEYAANPEARQFVDGVRATARQLKAAWAAEPSIALRPAQKQQLLAAAQPPVIRFPRRWFLELGAAAAIVVAILAVTFPAFQARLEQASSTPEAIPEKDISVAMVEPEVIQLDQLHPELEKIERLPELVAVTPPDTSLDAISAPAAVAPVQEPAEDMSSLALNVLNDSSPLVMKGLFASRSGGGRGSVMSRHTIGHVRMRTDGDQTDFQSGVISPSQDDFDVIRENPFQRVADHPLSTFSIDVDSASYAVVRRHLAEGRLPPKDAVRIEELINYFRYDYAPPTDGRPFAVHLAAAPCPWNPGHQLVRVALQARAIPRASRPALNLVFLVDVSGSMSSENRLPLVKRSLQALARQLDERDRIAMVVYAGAAGLVLPTTSGARTPEILAALEQLQAGGSTAGGAGIELAYATAQSQFVEGGVNRVILCTDGDFNVGLNQRGDLEKLIEEKARSGVFLTVLGFGMGNYKDSTLELLSGKGNGNYGYVDSFAEARRLLVDQMLGTLVTVARDVKIQVEFNPARIAGYRLVGYENRLLRKEDFNNDRVDAGDVGAGHSVTAFYELIPAGQPVPGPGQVDELKYQEAATGAATSTGEFLTAKLRYKLPDGDTSTRMDFPLRADALAATPDRDFQFASAVAGFGMILRDSAYRGSFTCDDVLELAEAGLGNDPEGYRRDFLSLVRNARALTGSPGPAPASPEAATDR